MLVLVLRALLVVKGQAVVDLAALAEDALQEGVLQTRFTLAAEPVVAEVEICAVGRGLVLGAVRYLPQIVLDIIIVIVIAIFTASVLQPVEPDSTLYSADDTLVDLDITIGKITLGSRDRRLLVHHELVEGR